MSLSEELISSTLNGLPKLDRRAPGGYFAVDRSHVRSALSDVDLVDQWVFAHGGRIGTDRFAQLPGDRDGPSVPRQWYVLPV